MTRPRSKPACSWPSAGSSPGCVTGASPPSPRRTPRSQSASADQRPAVQEDATGRDGALFEAVDARRCGRLPPERYEFATWKTAKVNIDYHVESPTTTTTRSPTSWSARSSRCACSAAHRRGLHSAAAGGLPPAQLRHAAAHHRSGPHARAPPSPCRVDPVVASSPGRRRPGPRQPSCVEEILACTTPSRTGLPVRPRHHPSGRALWHRAPRGGLCPGASPALVLLPLGRSRSCATASTTSPLPEATTRLPPRTTTTSAAGTYYR